jgi:WD40 repeat protein
VLEAERERLKADKAEQEAQDNSDVERVAREQAKSERPVSKETGFDHSTPEQEDALGLLDLEQRSSRKKLLTYLAVAVVAAFLVVIWIFWNFGTESQQKKVDASPHVILPTTSDHDATSVKDEWIPSGPIEGVELELVHTLNKQTPTEQAYDLAFSQDGQLLASAWQQIDQGKTRIYRKGNGSVRFWDVATGVLVRSLQRPGENRPDDQFNSLALSSDGLFVAAGASSETIDKPGTLFLWDAKSGALLRTFETDKYEEFVTVTFSPDNRVFAAGSNDGTVYLWDAPTGAVIKTLKHPNVANSLAFGKEGDIFVVGDQAWRPSVRVWDGRNWARIRDLYPPRLSAGQAVALSPDGLMLASGHGNGDLNIWDSRTWKLLRSMRYMDTNQLPIYGISSIAFTPDGQMLAAASDFSTVRFWDPANGRLLGTFSIPIETMTDAPLSHFIRAVICSQPLSVRISSGSGRSQSNTKHRCAR